MPVQQQVNQSAAEQIKENRMKLQSILKTVVFCGKLFEGIEMIAVICRQIVIQEISRSC